MNKKHVQQLQNVVILLNYKRFPFDQFVAHVANMRKLHKHGRTQFEGWKKFYNSYRFDETQVSNVHKIASVDCVDIWSV